MRDKKMQQRITLFLGIFLSFGMVASAVLPLLQNQMTNQSHSQTQATTVPLPTQLPPPDTSTITFDSTYFHPSALFTVAIPSTYSLSGEFNNESEALVTMDNPAAQSVLELRVLNPAEDVSLDSAQSLGEQFTSEWLRATWNGYSSWQEDARRVEGDNLIMDFSLGRSGQNYIARQVAFTDGTWIYMIRVIAPSNASESMQHVLNGELDSFQIIDRYAGEALAWDGYFDDSANHLLRFPGTWIVADGIEGAPASISGENAQLRVETSDATIDSADAASEYVAGLRSSITVLSVEEVEQYGNTGFRVAYTQSTADGASQSGAVLIINGADTNHVVNLLLTDVADADLNTVDVMAEDTAQNLIDARNTLDSFSLFPDMDIE